MPALALLAVLASAMVGVAAAADVLVAASVLTAMGMSVEAESEAVIWGGMVAVMRVVGAAMSLLRAEEELMRDTPAPVAEREALVLLTAAAVVLLMLLELTDV
jgi:hypothetical protein